MDDQNLKDLEREQADNKLIGDAFQHLLDTYVASRHRKKVDIVTKAFNKLFGKFTEQSGDTEAERQSGEKASAPSIAFNKTELDSAAQEFAQAVTAYFDTKQFAKADELQALSDKLDKAMVEPQTNHSHRPPATGGDDNADKHKADY